LNAAASLANYSFVAFSSASKGCSGTGVSGYSSSG